MPLRKGGPRLGVLANDQICPLPGDSDERIEPTQLPCSAAQ